MYQALYRKWRPRTFEEVVGQEHITTTLKNEMIQGKPAHAYLLMGSRGTGKTTCAKLIAKAVNCRNPVDGSPCGQCDCCRGVDNGSLVDVVEIDAASNNGVDNIRDLREEAVFLPNIAKYRVYIIDEAHMLSVGAVNALLKIMEEPPEHVIFILATTEVHKIPATIQSRCQRFDFKRIAPEVIRDRLLFIAGQEDMTLTEEAAALIARIADGGMRDALSLLDLCWAHAHDITVETVSEAAGLVGQDYLFEIADAAATGDFTGAMDAMERLAGQAVEYDRLCSQLISHYRNLLVAATARDPEQLIVCLPQTLEQYKKQAASFTPAALMDAIRTLQDTQAAMARSTSRRAEMELALLKLSDRRVSPSREALVARIEELEAKLNRLLAEGIRPAPAPAQQSAVGGMFQPQQEEPAEPEQVALPGMEPPPQQEEAAPPAAKPAATPVEPMPEDQWLQVLDRLGVINKMLARQSLKRAIAEVTGVKYGVGPYTAAPKATTPQSSPLEDLIKQAEGMGIPVTRE